MKEQHVSDFGKKPSIPRDWYINFAVKKMYFFNVRNIEGQSPSKHTVYHYFSKTEL